MHVRALYVLCMSAFSAPFLAIAVILVYYFLLRVRWRLLRRLGTKNPGFCPSSSEFGTALQFLQVIYRPNVAYVV
jgi:amino acid permease